MMEIIKTPDIGNLSMQKIDFFFDFLSPYSYFAWKNHLKVLGDKYEINYRPVLMGKLFSHWDIKGPGEIAPKRYTMLKSCFRYAAKNDIPFTPPAKHPFNPLYCLRLATKECSGDDQFKVIDALWDLIWGQGKEGDNPEEIETTLNAANLDAKALMDQAFGKEAKLAVKRNTKDALEIGLFGVPSFVVEKEFFWGNDALKDLKTFVETGDSFDEELFKQRTNDIVW
ncbi:MAG: 2-hydroxychromene-2-carboxylate isomerase [Bacteriovoracaceae bacterium]|nr:2-hydroxychromene-2-carboxylate isomerase [Bacteriovoracaceae bacterium]